MSRVSHIVKQKRGLSVSNYTEIDGCCMRGRAALQRSGRGDYCADRRKTCPAELSSCSLGMIVGGRPDRLTGCSDCLLLLTGVIKLDISVDSCPVLETKDKPRVSYSEIRGYSEVYPRVKFWRFSNIFILGVTILGITRRCL